MSNIQEKYLKYKQKYLIGGGDHIKYEYLYDFTIAAVDLDLTFYPKQIKPEKKDLIAESKLTPEQKLLKNTEDHSKTARFEKLLNDNLESKDSFIKRGGLVIPITGNNLPMAQAKFTLKNLWDLKLNYGIYNNGSYVLYNGNIIPELCKFISDDTMTSVIFDDIKTHITLDQKKTPEPLTNTKTNTNVLVKNPPSYKNRRSNTFGGRVHHTFYQDFLDYFEKNLKIKYGLIIFTNNDLFSFCSPKSQELVDAYNAYFDTVSLTTPLQLNELKTKENVSQMVICLPDKVTIEEKEKIINDMTIDDTLKKYDKVKYKHLEKPVHEIFISRNDIDKGHTLLELLKYLNKNYICNGFLSEKNVAVFGDAANDEPMFLPNFKYKVAMPHAEVSLKYLATINNKQVHEILSKTDPDIKTIIH